MPTLFCENLNRKIPIPDGGVNLRAALMAEGVRVYRWPRNYLPLNCGGRGLCGTCVIQLVNGEQNLSPITGRERARLGLKAGEHRLSCQCVVDGDLTIRVRPKE